VTAARDPGRTQHGFAASETPPPDVTATQAAAAARDLFGVSGSVSELGSQQDRNFRIDAAGGTYVLKVANPAVTDAELACQNAAMRHLASAGMAVPTPHPSSGGADVVRTRVGDADVAVRLLDFVDGVPLVDCGFIATDVRTRLGQLAAAACRGLADFDHPALDRRLEWDLRHARSVVDAYAVHVGDAARRERLCATAAEASARLARVQAKLRTGPIHGDITDDNVVCRPDADGRPSPCGLIDFGDLGRSWVVAELAVTCASLLHHIPDEPLGWIPAVAAFHAAMPLAPAEIAALWPLVALRGATLVVTDEKQLSIDPDNAYVAENLLHDWRIFVAAASIPWELAEAAVCDAISVPVDDRQRHPVRAGSFRPLLPGLAPAGVGVADLSATSAALDEGRWLDPQAENAVFAEAGRGAGAALARYGEHRLTRASPDSEHEPATCALHAEIRLPSERAVRAPADGTVTIAGPATVVIACEGAVVRLAGAAASVATGDRVAAGDVVGVAPAAPASLRVQLCLSTEVDPPEFATPSTAPAWRRLCPDPSALLGIDCAAPPVDAAGVLARRERTFARIQGHYYAAPPEIERGWRHHLIDTTGRVYLDMVNNVAVVGHAHPRVARAIAAQSRLLNTNSRFNYAAVGDFCERLAALAPDGLDTVLLVNSGTEANDVALRLAWAHTGRTIVVALLEAYHGWSLAADAVSTSTADNPAAVGTRPGWVRILDSPNSYSGTHRGPGSGGRYVRDAVAEIDRLVGAGEAPAAFIAEALHGNAGGVLLPSGYLEAVYAAVRAGGGVCIADEVQVGYGRLGRQFWGFREQGVVPDVITVAKAMGNGHPLGAVITRREIAESFAAQGSFFSSTGGNPVSCRAGLAVLDAIEDEGLQENARIVGDHLRTRLEEMATRHPLIGAVHGMGLYAGVELVRGGDPDTPAPRETNAICERLRARGIIVQPTGDRLNILKIKPPLCITRESADFFCDQLDIVLGTGW
jgi:4-aminobutyrate aminotransferase-like enzyme/Ser/Thr protein kinase RdoA (MazF antagonist)